jgi:hypothetical protein
MSESEKDEPKPKRRLFAGESWRGLFEGEKRRGLFADEAKRDLFGNEGKRAPFEREGKADLSITFGRAVIGAMTAFAHPGRRLLRATQAQTRPFA